MEPLRSANSTVTCLRSPSRAVLEVRIFSARCFGVYASGGGGRRGDAPGSRRAPHSPQNFWVGALPAPHCRHSTASRLPHSPQDFIAAAFSLPHCRDRVG